MDKCSLDFVTSPPKVCGIGEYSDHIIEELKKYCEIHPVYIEPHKNPFYYIKKADECSRKLIHVQFEYGFFWGIKIIHGIYAWLFYPIIARDRYVITTFHEILHKSIPDALILRLISFYSKKVIVHTTEAKERLLQAGVKEDKIEIIPHGVLYTAFPLDKKNAKRELNIEADEKTVLFFGFLHRDKGVDNLIEAMKGIDATLIIAGDIHPFNKGKDGWYLENLHFLANDPAVKVKFLGYVSDEKIPLVMSAADIAVLPYKKILQSGVFNIISAYKIPCLASKIRFFDDTNRQYHYPYIYTNLHDDIVRLFRDFELRNQLTKFAENYNADNSIENVVRKTVDIYKKILEIR
ncbi:MAG TPA: glycosyltransferase [Methanoregulaceae archaeon]|jgi:glycosyltransferase involved in cell wall biosynthesis|nr:glycosyltransferase [Methanoregulaceae archaeon]HPW09845.1 glycosyltransferase [Methanoregulaceae archaeon]HQM56508.1 glycosyltransferase [Methanoregulaceae archaeon]